MITKALIFKKNTEAFKKAIQKFRNYLANNEDASPKECWEEASYEFRRVINGYLSEFSSGDELYMYSHLIFDDCRDGLICQCKKEYANFARRKACQKIQRVYVESSIVPLLKKIDEESNHRYNLRAYDFYFRQNSLAIILYVNDNEKGSKKRILRFNIKYSNLYDESINDIALNVVKMLDLMADFGPFISSSSYIRGRQENWKWID
ncbi:MAG: hypothetical protein MJZ72_09465 [Bacteroidales bacterium]|nr:hypothetical protein [Bacteroidales bacterium]